MEVRFFKKSERQLLLDSIDRLWKHDHIYVRQPEVLEHLVLNTPYRVDFAGEENYSFLGLWHNGEVIGLFGAMPNKYNVLGTSVMSSTGTIWVVQEKYRGMGILLLKHMLDSGIGFYLALGMGVEVEALYRAVGCRVIRNLPRWVGIQRMDEASELLLKNKEGIEFYSQIVPRSLRSTFHISDELDSEKWDKFFHNVFSKRYIGTMRDYAFLKWRYKDAPIFQYQFRVVTNDTGDCVGLGIFRIEEIMQGLAKIGRILEFIAFDEAVAIQLANSIVCYDSSVLFWDFYCLSGIVAYGLESIGFCKVPEWQNENLLPTRFQPVDWEYPKILGAIYIAKDIKRKITSDFGEYWYITRGDADQDRPN